MLAERLPPEFTGSGKQAVFLARALRANHVQTLAICSDPWGRTYMDPSWGFPVFHLPASRKKRHRALQFAFRSVFWLFQHRRQYDLVHVHGYCLAAIPVLIVSKLLGKKSLYKITLPGEDDPLAIYHSRFGWMKSRLLERFDAFIAISGRVQKYVQDFGCPPSKIFMIPNGVDKGFYYDEGARGEARKRLLMKYKLDENCQIISYTGSIEHRKGVDLLARAWPKILSAVPESRLFLAGPTFQGTPFYRHLVDLTRDHLDQTIFIVGIVNDPENYYRASDVFVFPARNEGFGNVLLEAMACGAPCVATRIEGLTENILIDRHNGLVVENGDDQALADRVLELLRDDHLKKTLAANAVKTIEEKFRMDRIAQRYIDLYASLLSLPTHQNHFPDTPRETG